MNHDHKLHPVQVAALRMLLMQPQAGFAELQRRSELPGDHFIFHLKRLMTLGYVERSGRGLYCLSAAGKTYANRLDTNTESALRQGLLSVLIVPWRLRGETPVYAVQRRLKQPFYGRYGFMSGKIGWGETVAEAVLRNVASEMGLAGKPVYHCLYHKLDYATDGRLLEDKHFHLVSLPNPRGQLLELTSDGSNAWLSRTEITQLAERFPSMLEVIDHVQQVSNPLWEARYYHPIDTF